MTFEEIKRMVDTEILRVKDFVQSKKEVDPEDFNTRGELYRMAALIGPNSREQDILNMYKWIRPQKGEVSLEIAAGTGFLTKNIAEWTESKVYALDPSEIQLKTLSNKCAGLPVIPILGSLSDMATMEKVGEDIGNINFATSFGGIHHIVDSNGENNQKKTFENISRALKTGGRFVAADVSGNTSLSVWFETIVKKYCLTGHSEKWLDADRLKGELIENTSLEYTKSEIVPLQWVFETKNHMATFMKALNALDLPDAKIIEKLSSVLGFKEVGGKIILDWPMLFFDIRKK